MAEQARPPTKATAPTLVDVARAAGVSRQTVSNVINAPERVRPETRERVELFIARLGYQPNRLAQALRANTSRMVGYRIEPPTADALDPFHDRLLHSLSEAGRAADRHLLLFPADDDAAEIEVCQRLHRGAGVEAFVLYGVEAQDPRPRALIDLGVPFVAFGRTAQGSEEYAWVDVDNFFGIAAAVDHLVRRGHRRIGYVGLKPEENVGGQRARGWHAAIDRQGLPSDCHALVLCGQDTVPAGMQMAFALLERSDPPTAIVTASDTLAVGVMRAAQQWGVEVGRDLAVVGFDDSPTAAALELSSIRQPMAEIGQQIMATLLGLAPAAEGGPGTAQGSGGKLLMPTLIVRSSSASPAPRTT
ncbi:LacI family DNA-binding transcriptional regulator [Streptomyces mirabilis]|uniref:LacI family DNA-binding transcriptional regulator n=1 Tax=Streptomyces TaxID=1883 RepID=UPI0029A0B345|nr:LacI family DNA-binding transcriptional regulator [Streptomyces sp. AK02-04a]MDX3762286.1 LacI family DNA-binding transcriptional regulator [Streptomyces sp. AK02-04a]